MRLESTRITNNKCVPSGCSSMVEQMCRCEDLGLAGTPHIMVIVT